MEKAYISIAQKNFADLNLSSLREIFESFADNKERAIRFVLNPDRFMHKEVGKAVLSPNMHFHVVIGNRMHPPEEGDPENQIMFTARIQLGEHIRDEVFAEFEKVTGKPDPDPPKPDPPKPDPPKPDPDPPGPPDCPGCGECARVMLY